MDHHPAHRAGNRDAVHAAAVRAVATCLCLVGLLAAAGCASLPPEERPDWVRWSRSSDVHHIYQVGQASGYVGREAAREAAQRSALVELTRAVLSDLGVRDVEGAVRNGFVVSGASVAPGRVHYELDYEGYTCWVQLTYPVAEKHKLAARIKLGAQYGKTWQKARGATEDGRYEEARARLAHLIRGYGGISLAPFTLDDAKLLLGDTYAWERRNLEARQCYEHVLEASKSPDMKAAARQRLAELPPAPLCWPLSRRFKAQGVALLCLQRDGGALKPFPELAASLAACCADARLKAVDISSRLESARRMAAVERRQFGTPCRLARTEGAGVLLVVVYDTDPAKQHATEEVFGMPMAVMDTTVTFYVIRSRTCDVHFDGTFKELAGRYGPEERARRAAGVLIQKYLLSQCPVM